MFVTCHITFGQLSNFVGPSLEVTRTIINNKLHLTWGCSVLLLKKEKGPETEFLFFLNDPDIFLKYFNSNHNLPRYSLFSKCFSWLFYLAVHRSRGVFLGPFFIFLLLLSQVTRSRARHALNSVWPKNAEKLRLFCRSRPPQWNYGFMVSSFLSSSYQNGW